MKLDYDIIKSILIKVRDETDGFNPLSMVQSDFDNDAAFMTAAHHYKILADNGFIDGSVREVSVGRIVPEEISVSSLTLVGHQLLEGMENGGLWQKIKSSMSAVGIEALKQVPGLAVQILTAAPKS